MKQLSLGTAMWGWAVDRSAAFLLLDNFYREGGRYIDTASNYPINGVSSDFGQSASFIAQWCKVHSVSDLKVTYKVGSVSNENTAQNDLTYNFLHEKLVWAIQNFGENLHCIMLHWDNRSDGSMLKDTCKFLKELNQYGIEVGLSGVKYPEIYRQSLVDIGCKELNIQLKYNFLHGGFEDYMSLSSMRPKYWAYGIAAGGLKLFDSEYNKKSSVSLVRPKGYSQQLLSKKRISILNRVIDKNIYFKSLYHISIAYSEQEDRLFGYIIAPARVSQLMDIFHFIEKVKFDQVHLAELTELKMS